MAIKLSGELVEEARRSAKLLNRSLTGQIEHWAAIGRAIESQLSVDALTQLLERVGGTMKIGQVADADQRQQIVAVLAEFLSQTTYDRAWLRELNARGVPLYGSEPDKPGVIVRLNTDGSKDTIKVAEKISSTD